MLDEPFQYLRVKSGKNMREALINAFNTIVGVPAPDIQDFSTAVADLHTTSMLIDDVEDDASFRRGAPAAHTVFGVVRTINSSYYVVFRVLESFKTEGLRSICLEEIINLHRGQGLDIYWRDQRVCPSESEYIDMVRDKTGGLLRMALRLMLHVAPSSQSDKLLELADTLGILYQIQDDLLNLVSDKYAESKGFCEDLTEGKYSFPVIHCMHHANKEVREGLENILVQHTQDVERKRQALQYLVVAGSLEYTRSTVKKYYERAVSQVEDISNNSALKAVLEKFVMINDI